MKVLKILGSVFVILILLAAIGMMVIRKMFPPEKMKELIVREASQKLKREVRLGEIKIGLLSGISVKDFALSESPNFKNGTFIQSEKFILKFELLPLLRKKVIIHEVGLDAPQIRIVQNADGKTFNFSDLTAMSASASEGGTATATPAPTEKGAPAEPISLTISKAEISKGKVEFVDKSPKKIKVTLMPIDLTASGTGLTKPISLDFAIGVEGAVQGKNIKGILKTKATVELPTQKIQFESFQWKMDAFALDLKGKFENFSKPEIEFAASLHDVHIEKLSPWVAMPKELTLAGAPQLGLELKGNMENLNLALSLDLFKTELAYSDLFRKGEDKDLSLHLNGKLKNQKNLILESLKIKLAGLETTLKGEIQKADSSDPLLKIELNTNAFDLKEIASFSALAKPYNPSGQISLQANVAGSLKWLRLNGSLGLEKIQAAYEKTSFHSISGKIDFTENSVEIPQLTGKMEAAGKTPSEFGIHASVKNFSRPDISLDAHFSALDLGMFLSEKKKEEAKAGGEAGSVFKDESGKGAEKKTGGEALSSFRKAEPPYKGPVIQAQGQVSIGKVVYTKFEGQNAKASWKLTGITPGLNLMNGAAQFEMQNGKINKIPMLTVIAPILNIDPSGLVYSRMGGQMTIAQGTAKTEDFQINSPAVDLFAKGTLHLPTNKPDIVLTAKLPKGSIGGSVGEFANDEAGRPTFAFKMKNDWKPVLDSSQIQKKVVEKATQEIKKKAAELLQGEGKKLLDGLFKR